MGDHGIPLDKAELLSVLMEAILYGFSLLMFVITVWSLSSRRTTEKMNGKMLIVACLLLLFSTVHFVIDIVRIMEGLVLFRDTFPEGPIGYFSDVSQWTFVSKNYVYTAQTLIGDGVVLYRCYAVWQSKSIMILPVLLWCAVLATGIGAPYTASQAAQEEVFGGSLSRWITSFFASTFTTNLFTTSLLAYRIWYVDHQTANLRIERQSQLRTILHMVIDAGLIYSVTLFAALMCFVNESNGQYVILDMVTPIISITFYMIIIRVALANRKTQWTSTFPLVYDTSMSACSMGGDRGSKMQVHIATSTTTKIESGRYSLMNERNDQSERKVEVLVES